MAREVISIAGYIRMAALCLAAEVISIQDGGALFGGGSN